MCIQQLAQPGGLPEISRGSSEARATTPGNAAIVTAEELPAIFSCKSTVLRCHDESPWFLLGYLNSKPGQALLLRNARGTVQTGLNLDDIRAFKVP